MHEASMTIQLIEYVISEASKRNAKAVSEIYIEIGELTHLNPEQISFLYYSLTRNNSLLKNSKLYIKIIEGIAECTNCNYRGKIPKIEDLFLLVTFKCPKCGSKLKIIKGDEFVVKRIKMII